MPASPTLTLPYSVSTGQLPASVVTDSRLGAGFVQSGGIWLPDYTKLVAAESGTPWTLYVANVGFGGSDSNPGNSPGKPLLTIAKALQLAAIAQRGVEIVLVGNATGYFDVAAPLSPSYSTFIRCGNPSGAGIRRNFTTPNSRSFYDATAAASATQVSSASASFTNADVNRIVSIYGVGVGGGTFYDFIASVPDATHASFTALTTIARAPATELSGTVKGIICGDWNRVVTDASISAGQSVITSLTAAWSNNDLNTEVVIAGAGQGGQALRATIKAVSGNTATIVGIATNTVTNARCAIGVNFGNLFTFWPTTIGGGGGAGGLRNVQLLDTSIGQNSIGAAIALMCVDAGSGVQSLVADLTFENLYVSNSDSAGGWEHDFDADGSWNQKSSGPGIRRVNILGCKFFGSRTPGETIRLSSTTHMFFEGGGIVGAAPTTIPQGIRIFDPQNTGGIQLSSDVNHFCDFEGTAAYVLCEGQRTSYQGDISPSIALTGRRAIELGKTSISCNFLSVSLKTVGVSGANADIYDAGTNNVTPPGLGIDYKQALMIARQYEGSAPLASTGLRVETISRRSFLNATQTIGSSGVQVMMSIWLPAGFPITRLALFGGSTPLAWGTGWTGQHFIYGIHDPSGTLYGQTADGGGTATFSNTASNASSSEATITKDGSGVATSTVYAPTSGLNWISLLINSGTGGSGFTYPTFAGLNAGAWAQIAPALCGTTGSGLTALTNALPSGATNLIYGGVG